MDFFIKNKKNSFVKQYLLFHITNDSNSKKIYIGDNKRGGGFY